jgi:EAL domain-containing protein (putative c-di-GMP-specific phosphodiesterase class I)
MLATGRVVGLEALVRWNHPTLGLLPPGEIIGLAEETGLIIPLGRWILQEACFQARAWPNRSPGAPLMICINISMHQLETRGLVADVIEALTASGLVPSRLELELTESETMQDPPEAGRILRELRTLGVKLAIDDFGTGFASLTRLRQQGFDRLKINRSFVAGLGRDRHSLAIVRAVTILAHDLGMSVTAEGVETDGQVALLRELGVDFGQGYYFARPHSEAAIVERLDLGNESWGEASLASVVESSVTHA